MNSFKEKDHVMFFKKCNEQGYTDMADETQALKAKVIAKDLGLNYRNIKKTYDVAKECYKKYLEKENLEKEYQEKIKLLQKCKGTKIFTIYGTDDEVNVYISESNIYYYTCNDDKYRHKGVPSFELKTSSHLTYKYHPPKAIYSGATIGGIHMGDVHVTDGYMTQNAIKTGKGYINAYIKNKNFQVRSFVLSKDILNKFKRDEWLKIILKNKNTILCYDPSAVYSKNLLMQSALKKESYYDQMSSLSSAMTMDQIDANKCQRILKFIDDVLRRNFPPTDEEQYQKATSLENANDSNNLLECLRIYKLISDYKDSASKIEQIQKRYETILQNEKEQKIIESEKRRKKAKKIFIILAIIFVVLASSIVTTLLVLENKQNKTTYQNAISFMNQESYNKAINNFNSLDDYKDSEEKLKECFDLWLVQANEYIKEEKYEEAKICMNRLVSFSKQYNSILTGSYLKEVVKTNEVASARAYLKEAIKKRDTNYIALNLDLFNFKKLSGAEIKKMFVGKWYKSQYVDSETEYNYKTNGTRVYYYEVHDYKGNTVEKRKVVEKFEIVDDYLQTVDNYINQYEIYDMGNGYYLCLDIDIFNYSDWYANIQKLDVSIMWQK